MRETFLAVRRIGLRAEVVMQIQGGVRGLARSLGLVFVTLQDSMHIDLGSVRHAPDDDCSFLGFCFSFWLAVQMQVSEGEVRVTQTLMLAWGVECEST